MAFLALLVLVFVPYTLFNVGGTAPQSGLGTYEAPQKLRVGNARLTIKSVEPFVVAGSGFKAGESVRLSTEGSSRRLRASGTGSFTARVPGGGRCNGGTIVAVGSRGSRAALNLSQLLCPVP